MSVAKGRAFLMYVGDADAPITGTAIQSDLAKWHLVAGAQERSVTVNNEAIDGTTAPASLADPLWQTQLAGAKSVTIECAFRYTNEQAERRILDEAWSEESHIRCLLVYPPDDTGSAAATDSYGAQIFGEFLITSLSSTGGLSDTFNASLSLTSTGPIRIVHGAS